MRKSIAFFIRITRSRRVLTACVAVAGLLCGSAPAKEPEAPEQPVRAAVKAGVPEGSEPEIPLDSAVPMRRTIREVRIAGQGLVRKTVSVQQLSREELLRFHPQQVGELVKRFSGVQVKDYGGIGGMKTVSVRSLGAAHTAVVYDGIVLGDAQNGQIDLSKLSLERIGAVRLYNAMPGSLFAPARHFSAAAVLEVVPQTALADTQRQTVALGLTGGSFGFWSPALGYEQRIGRRVRIGLDGQYTRVKGDYPYWLANGTASERQRRDNADVQSGHADLHLNAQLNERQTLDVGFHYDESDRGLPGAVIFYAPSSQQRWHERTLWAQARHVVAYGHGFSQKSALKYAHDYTRFLDPQALTSSGLTDDRYRRQEVYASTAGLFQPLSAPRWSFSAALDAAYTFLSANTPNFVYPHRTSLWLNVAGAYRHPYVEVEANLLNSAYWEGVQSGAAAAENRFKASPAVSVGVMPLGQPAWVIRLFYKDIFRMPTFTDLYYDRVGNAALRPEKARMADFGMSYVLEASALSRSENALPEDFRLEINADVYKQWVTDKIVAFPTKNLFRWTMMNVGKADITGVDASLKITSSWGKTGVWRDFGTSLYGTYTFQWSRDMTDPAEPTYNRQITYTPVHAGSGGITLSWRYLSLSYGLTWSGARYCLPENRPENRLAPYADHNLSLTGRWRMWKGQWEAGVDWLNVANTSYEIVRYYPMPGSQFRITLKCRY